MTALRKALRRWRRAPVSPAYAAELARQDAELLAWWRAQDPEGQTA